MARQLVPSIARDHVTEDEHNGFSTAASTLGFPVDAWPAEIATSLGNGQSFVHTSTERVSDTDGEIVSAIYEQGGSSGVILTVIND